MCLSLPPIGTQVHFSALVFQDLMIRTHGRQICVFRLASWVFLMWDVPLYAVNVFYYHWLIEKLLWSMAGKNIARQEIQEEMEEERRQSHGDATM